MAKKILAICAALVAFAAVPAMASASPELQTSGGVKVAVGTQIKATNVGNVVFTTNFGNITCTSSTMTGEVVENSGTSIKGTIKTASFTGNHDGTTNCVTTIPGITMVKVTPEISSPSNHWCLTSTVSPNFSIRGGGCSEAAKGLKFTLDLFNSSTEAIGSCSYERTAASGPITGTYVPNVSPLELTVTGGNVFARLGENFLCPSSGTLDAKYKVQTSTGGELKVV
jgi:hypothetical protein